MFQDRHASFACNHASATSRQIDAPMRVGLLGLGTVGAGTYRVLQRNADVIEARAGRRIEIAMVAVRNLSRAAGLLGDGVGKDLRLVDDPFQVVMHPDIDVVVEVIGGTTLARELVLR